MHLGQDKRKLLFVSSSLLLFLRLLSQLLFSVFYFQKNLVCYYNYEVTHFSLLIIIILDSSSTTTEDTSATVIYWPFDNTTNDLTNSYNSTSINNPSYFLQSTSQPYAGVGQGLLLLTASSQYVSVDSPFIDFTFKSFTIEFWIYPTAMTSSVDYGLIGQCQCSSCPNQCFYLIIRSTRLYVSFMNNDLPGNQTFSTGTWYHIAFVYNYQNKQQTLYINGYQDVSKTGSNAYQGVNGTLTIGAARTFSAMSYYNGYLDNVKITFRAKTATEILNAATLTAYYSFNLPNPTYDNGPLGLNGTANNTAIISGRVNEAMLFSGSVSYFYAYGFYQTAYAYLSSRPFSVSLWINPSAYRSCAFVQVGYQLTNYACQHLLGLFSNSGATMQVIAGGWSNYFIYGPFIQINTWTHISMTYSSTNGIRLYINGVYFGGAGPYSYANSGYIVWLELGYITPCSSSVSMNAGYQGAIDEVYMHSRELTASEVSVLANP